MGAAADPPGRSSFRQRRGRELAELNADGSPRLGVVGQAMVALIGSLLLVGNLVLVVLCSLGMARMAWPQLIPVCIGLLFWYALLRQTRSGGTVLGMSHRGWALSFPPVVALMAGVLWLAARFL